MELIGKNELHNTLLFMDSLENLSYGKKIYGKVIQQVVNMPTIEAEPVNLEELSQALTDEVIAAHERIAYDRGFRDGYAEAIEAEPIKHGRWVDVGHGRWHACSVCEGVPLFNAKFEDALTPYCPHCGAQMDL